MKHGNTLKTALAMVACLSVASLAQLPTLKITASSVPTTQSQWTTNCNIANKSNSIAPINNYVSVSKFELNDPSDSRNNFTRSGEPDSIRRRGNSTASMSKIPFRMKFDKRQTLFGMESKSWALLANYYDGSMMLNAIAFELGKRLGIEFTPKYKFVKLELNNTDRGIYLLTPQISGNQYSVNIDRDNGGWLVEFDYHDPNNNDCQRYFVTSKYDLKTKIRYPEWGDDVTDSSDSRYRNLKNNINNLVNTMSENSFPNSGYRDLMDVESWAKYVLVELFMDNSDFNSKFQTGGLLGSNYAYRIDNSSKIKAGPLWDFDLAAGVTLTNFPAHYQNYTDLTEPTHDFYKRLWSDTEFLTEYKRAWDNNKHHFEDISACYIDSLLNLLKSNVQGNVWNSGTLTENTFNTQVSNLKTWWNNRMSHFGGKVSGLSTPGYTSPSGNSGASACGSGSGSGGNSSSSSSSGGGNLVSSSSSANNNSGTLSCTGLQTYVAKGGVISTPTLTCSNGSAANNPVWTGGPRAGWSEELNGWSVQLNTISVNYDINVTAECGGSSLSASCGIVTVDDELATPIKTIQQIASGNGVSAIKNGVNLQVQNTARLNVYSISGKLEKTVNFGSGVHSVSFNNLPKGMYIVKAMFGSEQKVLRISVM